MKVQKNFPPPKYGLCLGLCHANVCVLAAVTASLVAHVQHELSSEPIAFHPLDERRQDKGIVALVAAAAEALQPVDLAPQLVEALHILHIDPEMPASVGAIYNVDR